MKRFKKIAALMLIAAAVASMFSFGALAAGNIAYGAATVDATSLNVRAKPDIESDRVTTVIKGSIIVILEKTKDDWWKVNYNGYVGYVASEYLTDVLTAENFKATGTVTGSGVRLRKSPSTNSDTVATVDEKTTLPVIGINKGWYKVVYKDTNCYVRSDLMEITGGPGGKSAASATKGQKIANFALQYLGYRYVFGSESPSKGFDCSGLVYYTYGQFGYKLSRTASQQFKNDGKSVAKDELQEGDLVFFSSNGNTVTHVGIYIGDNEFVHASTSDTGVIISNLTSAYYTRVWFGAKRIV